METLLLKRRMQLQNEQGATDPYELDYFTITCMTSGSLYFYVPNFDGSFSNNCLTSLSIKKNDGPWVNGTFNGGSSGDGDWYFNNDTVISLTVGDELRVKGTGVWYSDSTNRNIMASESTMHCSLSGNINSLIYGDNFVTATTVPNSGLRKIFIEEANTSGAGMVQSIYDATNLRLPAKTLGDNAYDSLFFYTSKMKTGPATLPATTIGVSCYSNMFHWSSITIMPEIMAVNLSERCCFSMFNTCSSLKTAQEILPANTMQLLCYSQMFQSCTQLERAPVLPATTIGNRCYNSMFRYCNKLKYVKAMFLTEPGTAVTSGWLGNVASKGTFVKNSAATWTTTGASGVPSGWTIQYASS